MDRYYNYQLQIQMTTQQPIQLQVPETLHSLPTISSLIHYQSNFIQVLHANVLLTHDPHLLHESLMRFQLDWLSNCNQKLTTMIKQLTQFLITQKLNYNTQLRDSFHRVFNLDFLPLLRFSRYQLTQVSLYGFDIYVQPIQALLEIINRITNAKDLIIKEKDEHLRILTREGIENLQGGYQKYMRFANLWRISFNTYMLKEYLKISSKSLVRKEKEIIFTGCHNIFSGLVTKLASSNTIWLLLQLSQLNNQLYFFHPSYDLIPFYTMLSPFNDSFHPIFQSLQVIAIKCQQTNILTPFLFAILRNYSQISSWIQQLSTNIWSDYVKVFLAGLMINIRARILQYEEVLHLVRISLDQMGLLNIDVDGSLLQDLGPEWNEAKQFFITALKFGYNVGELQTWHVCSAQHIQDTIEKYLINSLLLLKSPTSSTLLPKLLQDPPAWAHYLLQTVSQQNLTLQAYTNTHLKITYASTDEHPLLFIIRMVNLVRMSQLRNNPIILINLCEQTIKVDCNTCLLQDRLNGVVGDLVGLIERVFEQKQVEDKHIRVIKQFYNKFQPPQLILPLSNIFIRSLNCKEALSSICSILPSHYTSNHLVANIISSYISQDDINNSKLINVKTFHKQFTVQEKYFNLYNKERSLIIALIELIIHQQHPFPITIITSLIKVSKRLCLSLLMCPTAAKDNNLLPFSSWLLSSPANHSLLMRIINEGLGVIRTSQNEDYFLLVTIPSLAENVISHINSIIGSVDTFEYLLLLEQLYRLNSPGHKYYQDILKLYRDLIPLLAINLNTQQLTQSLHSYAAILTQQFITQQQWPQQYSAIIKYNILYKADREIAFVDIQSQMQHINNVTNTFCILHHDDPSKEVDLPLIHQQKCLQLLASPQPQHHLHHVPHWFNPLPLGELDAQLDWRDTVILMKDLILPQLPKAAIHYLLNQSPLPQHFLTLLFLNPYNCLECLLFGLEHNQQLVRMIGYIRLLNSQFDTFHKLVSQRKEGEEIVGGMIAHLNEAQLETISTSYHLKQQHIPLINSIPPLQFLVLKNQSNWRLMVDWLVSKMEENCITSVILQYEQYLQITNCLNNQYSKQILNYQAILQHYSQYLSSKQHQLSNIRQQPQHQLAIINEIANAKIFISAAKAKETLPRLGKLNHILHIRNLKQFTNVLSLYHQINDILNALLSGSMLIPDFISSKVYENSTLVKEYQFYLGSYLEQYEQANPNSIKHPPYLPHLPIGHDPTASWESILSQLSHIIHVHENTIEFIHTLEDIESADTNQPISCVSQWEEALRKVRLLGRLYCERGRKEQLSSICRSCLDRNKLEWELIKQSHPQQYHQIKSILISPKIHEDKLDIHIRNQTIRVTQGNKLDCCNTIALACIGEKTIQAINEFINGMMIYYA